MSQVQLPASSFQLLDKAFSSRTRSWKLKAASSQTGVSSMMVLILVVLLIIVGWEIGQFASQYSKTGQEALEAAVIRNKACVGSNTTYDCYDQDEGTDFVDN